MKFAIIGGGAAGLVSARHVVEVFGSCDVFEQSDKVGGTWNYSETPNKNQHSSMYKNLRTNLPKELMTFQGHGYPQKVTCSYPFHSVILDYLRSYAEKFKLKNYIKFNTLVKKVTRVGHRWKLIVLDLLNHEEYISFYDYILICNGHFSQPSMPDITGMEKFEGKIIHSHCYRDPESYSGQTVLTIGVGPSGQDISLDVSTFAHKVYVSHHSKIFTTNGFPSNMAEKPDVESFTKDSAVFTDGSSAQIDVVIFCTGYLYSFPFLDDTCKVVVDNNYVTPLFKQFISIHNPSMAFIGLPFRSFIFPMLETQVKCFLNIVLGIAQLPNVEEMEGDTRLWEMKNRDKGKMKKRYHELLGLVREYYAGVVQVGNVEPVPEVMFLMFERCSQMRRENLLGYRDENFTVVDSNNFLVNVK